MSQPARSIVVTALLALACVACLGRATAAQEGAIKPQWNLRLNETRGPLRAADTRPLGRDAVSEVLAGPTNGSDQGYIVFTRMPTGAHGPSQIGRAHV